MNNKNNEKEIKEQMRDEFAFWFIENKDKPITILNLETDKSKSIKLEKLKEELGIDFYIEDIIYFHNSIDEIELIIKVGGIEYMYLIYLGNNKIHEKWIDAQIKYLELNYKNYTNKELAETLGRSESTVKNKLSKLGLKRRLELKDKEKMINEYLQMTSQNGILATTSQNYKVCSTCKKVLPISNFYKNKSMKDGYEGYCIKCSKQYYIDRESKKRQEKAYQRFKESLNPMEDAKERTAKETYTCKTCGKTLLGVEFYFNNNTLKRNKECKKCMNLRNERNALKRILERGCI